MINPVTKLTVLHDDNSVFSDHSNTAADYLRDTFSMTLSSTEDYLYLGYRKNFGAAYFELATANTNANTLTAEYYDGAAWQSLELTDETNGLTRSGYMFWDKSNMVTGTINTIDKFYIRLRPSADHTATTVTGINLVFADDTALKAEFHQIDQPGILPSSQSSHINRHVAARNTIIEHLRNEGYLKRNSDGDTSILDQWDLIDIFEIREASVNLALSRIFFELSDSLEDHWWIKYLEYRKRYERSMQGIRDFSVDSNDDGVDATAEKNAAVKTQRWRR